MDKIVELQKTIDRLQAEIDARYAEKYKLEATIAEETTGFKAGDRVKWTQVKKSH